MQFTLVEVLRTKVGIAPLFCESEEIIPRIHGTALPHDENRDLITIYHPKMDWAYAKIRYPEVFSSPEDPPHSLANMVIPGIYVWDSAKLVSEDGETCKQSRRSRTNVEAVDPDSMVSAGAVLSKVHLTDSETSVPACIAEGTCNFPEPIGSLWQHALWRDRQSGVYKGCFRRFARQHFGWQRWKVRVWTSIHPRKLPNCRNCR